MRAEDEMWGVDAGVRDVRRDERVARLAAAGSSGRGGPTFEHTQGGEGRSDPDIALRGKKTRNIWDILRFYRLPMCDESFELRMETHHYPCAVRIRNHHGILLRKTKSCG